MEQVFEENLCGGGLFLYKEGKPLDNQLDIEQWWKVPLYCKLYGLILTGSTTNSVYTLYL